jgi:hypothetical protein
MATAVDAAIIEIKAAIAAITPQLEGLRDFSRLNLEPGTQEEVQKSITIYDRRFALLTAAENSLETLVIDGYPDVPVSQVEESVFADLSENASTIEAALKQFTAAPLASSLSFTTGPVETK